MFVLSNLVLAIAKILDIALNLYMMILVVRALASWLNPDPYNPIVQFLVRTTEPILQPIRSRLPMMPIDLSPMIVILAIVFLQTALVGTLFEFGYSLR